MDHRHSTNGFGRGYSEKGVGGAGLNQRIDRIANDQEEVVDRLREMQLAVNEALLLLRAMGGPAQDELQHYSESSDLVPLRSNRSNPRSSHAAERAAQSSKGSTQPSSKGAAQPPSKAFARSSATSPKKPFLKSKGSSSNLEVFPAVGHQYTDQCDTLPQGWPMSVQLRKGMRGARALSGDLVMSHLREDSTVVRRQLRWRERPSILLGPWNPHSSVNVTFDCMGLFILLYDLCSTPVQLAWRIPMGGPLYWCSWFSVLYWTVCIPIALRTGFYECGELKMSSREIAWNYVRRYFHFDAPLVLVDWISIMTNDPQSTLGALRFFRLFKIFRALKIMAIFDKIVSHRLGNNSKLLVLVKVGGFTLIFTHMMCCAWYALGCMPVTDTDSHWIDGFIGQDKLYLYVAAYHWVLNQITLGSNDVNPTNSYERVFGIILNVFGLLYSSTIVSIVSAQAMEYVTIRRRRLEDMSRLSGFLDQHKVELRMANRVRRQANDRLKRGCVMLTEDHVKALSILSADLRSDILLEVRRPHVVTHPLFQYWARIDVGATRRLCQEAVFFLAFMPQDCIFMPGVSAQEAFYVTPDRSALSILEKNCPMSYTQTCETAFVDKEVTVQVKEGAWVAEAALWTEWTHVGKLTAHYTCQLLAVDAFKLQDILSASSRIADFTRLYAREFCLRLHVASPPFSPWPTDLHVPHADPDNLLSEHAYRGLLMREWNAGNLSISREVFDELVQEVTSEKSAVICVPGEGLQRVVFVCTLQLQTVDGNILVQVGKWTEKKGVEPVNPVLPGTKRDRNELPQRALQRLLQTDMHEFQEGIELTSSIEEAEYKESGKYGMMTKYLRTVNFAELREDFEMPPLPVAQILEEAQDIAASLPRYCNTDVYLIKTKEGKADLYAWLSEAALDLLRGPEQDVLKSWIMSLDPTRSRTVI